MHRIYIFTPQRLAYITNIYKSQTEALIGSEKRAWETKLHCIVLFSDGKSQWKGKIRWLFKSSPLCNGQSPKIMLACAKSWLIPTHYGKRIRAQQGFSDKTCAIFIFPGLAIWGNFPHHYVIIWMARVHRFPQKAAVEG